MDSFIQFILVIFGLLIIVFILWTVFDKPSKFAQKTRKFFEELMDAITSI